MKPGQIIKHKNAMDVCLLIDKIRGPYGPKNYMEITGCWINMGFIQSFFIHERSKFKLPSAELFRDWQICQEPIEACLRYVSWYSL